MKIDGGTTSHYLKPSYAIFGLHTEFVFWILLPGRKIFSIYACMLQPSPSLTNVYIAAFI